MEKMVQIRLESRIFYAGISEAEKISQAMSGLLKQEGSLLELSYEEGQGSGEEPVYCRIRGLDAVPPEVTVSRTGGIHSIMHFKSGECVPAAYRTAFGTLRIEIAARKLVLERREDGFLLTMFYETFSGRDKVSETEFLLEVQYSTGKDSPASIG